jgi:hypothetical protein
MRNGETWPAGWSPLQGSTTPMLERAAGGLLCGTLTTTSISSPPSSVKTGTSLISTTTPSVCRRKPGSSKRSWVCGASTRVTAPQRSGPPAPNATRPNARAASAPHARSCAKPAGARSDEEFFDRLAAAGLLIRKRAAPSGDLLGYKVALPDDLNKDGEPVFYPGARLAPDLSLPRIRERWTGEAQDVPAAQKEAIRTGPGSPAAARRGTASAVWQAVLVIEHGDDAVAAAHIAAAGEVLDALAKTSAAYTRRELRDAATAFERASRSHIRAVRGHDRALRQAARDLVQGGPALGRGEDGATTAMALDMLFFLITAAAHWHARKGHAQQAEAAARAAEHLRTAYQAAASQPLGVLYRRGRRLSRPMLQRQTVLLREALPELAEQILAEPGWYALAATIAEAEAAGHDPAALLSDVAARRELGTADSVSDVLVWRMRRTADLPADASHLPETSTAGNRSTTRGTTTRPSAPGRRRSEEETPRQAR